MSQSVLHIKKGIGSLLFGMDRKAVEAELGKPDRKYKDDEANEIYIYNALKLSLTFYDDESYKLGYIVSSNPELTLLDMQPIGKSAESVINVLPKKQFPDWESSWEENLQSHFDEENWLLFVEEFGQIIKVELGAPIVKDEFVWAVK